MARIYIGRATGIGAFERHVVLKMILPERANDANAVNMFLDEARLAASLNHQNVAQVFEVGEDAGIHYLAMEYVHGQDLRALLAKAGGQGTRVPIELALTVVAGAAAGLNHAHERRGPDGVPLGIVHRDVSPSNIMVGYDGAVKLLDFGIAKATMRSVETQSGIIKGKFAYMSPEQCRGREVDRRSDVFSLGIILYEITTQHRCFRADSDFDTMHRIVTGDVVRPTRLVPGYPPALEAVVLKALSVDPVQRYQSAGFLLEAIEAFAMAARMSLSTMSLGRFMRELFGDQTEPWLQTGRASQQVIAAREGTISNTSTGGGQPMHPRPPTATAQEAPQARTILDLPRGGDEPDSAPNAEAWNAKSYPQVPPSFASQATLSPEGPAIGRVPTPQGYAMRPSGPIAMTMPQPQPLPLPPPPIVQPPPHQSGQHALPPPPPLLQSGSHSAMRPQPLQIASTRTGYAGAPTTGTGELSYPRYERPAQPPDDDVRLQPNRRPLYIGLAIAAAGLLVVILVAVWSGDGDPPDTAGAAPPATTNAAAPPAPPPPPTQPELSTEPPPAPAPPIAHAVTPPAPPTPVPVPAATPDAAPVAVPDSDESISIRVESTPPGADVLLAGKSIGTTPLSAKVPRGTGQALLTVHHAHYQDVTTKVDLGGDFAKEVALKAVPDDAHPASTSHPKSGAHDGDHGDKHAAIAPEHVDHGDKHAAALTPPAPKKPQCQAPGAVNPFDTSCDGKPCPPCKPGATP